MKTLKALSTKILAVLLLLPAMASAAPLLINYQGRLVDTAGNPLTGAQSILFSVYDAASAGSLLWSETQSVTPDNGIFSVSLGGVQTLPAAVFASDALYLEEDRRRRPADPAHAPALRALRAVRGQPRFSFQCGHRFHPHRRFRQPAAPG